MGTYGLLAVLVFKRASILTISRGSEIGYGFSSLVLAC